MTIEVIENEDGSFTISWDETYTTESIFNTWTAEDFTKAIMEHLQNLKDNG